jgi:hypothetical protein
MTWLVGSVGSKGIRADSQRGRTDPNELELGALNSRGRRAKLISRSLDGCWNPDGNKMQDGKANASTLSDE